MVRNTLARAGDLDVVLDDTVLDALGQLQGKYDAEFVARIITMFMETALLMLIRLKEGVVNGDFVALHNASHELKSCSATIGAYSLAAHCERLELVARERLVPDPASAVEAISIEYRRAEAALIARLAGLEVVQSDRAPVAASALEPTRSENLSARDTLTG
jgi:HPt (histidine-containing phosphotransfer) domain-containing protein